MNASLVGISIAFQAGEAVYIPVGHSLTAAPEQLDLQDVLGRLKPHLGNPALKKIGQNLKYYYAEMGAAGCRFQTLGLPHLAERSGIKHEYRLDR